MYDAAFPSEALQRARGVARLGFVRRGTETVLSRLRQEGCLKARFPRPEPGAWTSAVLLNSSGGIASGDVLQTDVGVASLAQATIATQAAERIYRAPPGGRPALVRTNLSVASGAALEWLPQETILFNRAALDRALTVDLAEDGWFLGVETLIFGRAEMGEDLHDATLHDLFRITRAGRPVLHDAIRLEGNIAATLARPAVAKGGRAIATIVHAAPDAEARRDTLRAALQGGSAECGASAWDGLLVARIVAPNGACARAAVLAGLATLRDTRPVPRVWLC